MSNVDPADIDLVLLASSSPDDTFGSACMVGGRVHILPSGLVLAVLYMQCLVVLQVLLCSNTAERMTDTYLL